MSGDHNQYQKATGCETNTDLIRRLEKQCWNYQANCLDAAKFAELIVQECAELNRKQGFNLSGVIADVKFSKDGFDEVCLNTVYGVEAYLFSDVFKKHFGFEE